MTTGQPLPIVVLDPGHGGAAKVGGSSPNNATGPNGLHEKSLTLDIARRAASTLAGHAQVILTRTNDTNLSLADRAAVARANNADVFLSIHFNGFHDRAVDGTEAWASRAAAHESVDFAQDVVRRLVALTRVADRGVRRADLGVLLPARLAPNTAACLVEIAFLTNPEQARRLEVDGYRQQLAEALAAAVLDRVAVPVGAGAPAAGGGPAATHSLGVASFIGGRLLDYFRNQQGTPLDPGAGGVSIGESALQIGDIIVSTTSHATSRLIQFGTGSQISHASIYIGGGQVVEAIGDGVVLRSLSDALAEDTVAVAFRYPGITSTQQLMVRDFAGRQLGRPYNYVGIVRQAAFQIDSTHCDGLPGELRATCRNWVGRVVLGAGNSDTFFCSQLVLAAYADAGIPLTSTPPNWASPQDIVNVALSTHLAYVGHLKAPSAGSQSLAVIASTVASAEERNRRMAAAIGGHGSPAAFGLATVTLGYGVPGGVITQPFYRDRTEGRALMGAGAGREHLGIDVSLSHAHGGGAEDSRRGLPVYAAIKRRIDIADLKAVRVKSNGESRTGVGIDSNGTAELSHAIADRGTWEGNEDMNYGGVVGLACRYTYTKADGTTDTFTLYLEYLHLITPTHLPKDGDGHVISADTWAATGKGTDYGPRIRKDARFTADELCGGDPILVGYLGATQFPHTHIQASFGQGEQRYIRVPRIDPTVMLRDTATTTQALALAAPSLALNDTSVSYDVPGVIDEIAQPSPNSCWATAATMLISWRDQASYPIATVCDMAGAEYRARFDADRPLAHADKPSFLHRLGFEEEAPANYTLKAYVDMMRAYGPLWVTTDVGTSGIVAIHARIMTGAEGDGSPAGSSVWLIDPADGKRHHETFEHFQQTFEQLARDAGAREPLWIQVVHNSSRQAPGG